MKIEIRSRFTSEVLFEHDAENNTVKLTVEAAVKAKANLDGANLVGANLDGANLDGARLDGANLYGANLDGARLVGARLDGANLYGANLDGANLYGADLYGASLSGANLNWSSHDLIAEILRRWAGVSVPRRMLAGLILVSRDWCWKDFVKIDHPEKESALAELRKWLKPGEKLPCDK